MILNMKVLVATGIFALMAMTITSLSIRQLAATRQADGKITQSSVVSSTFAELQDQSQTLTTGTQQLPNAAIDGRSYTRAITVEETEGGKLLEVSLEIEEVKDRPHPSVYRTRLHRL